MSVEAACKCKDKWLVLTSSPEPDLYEQWTCFRCGNRVIRAARVIRVRARKGRDV